MEHTLHHGLPRCCRERGLAGEHLVHHDAQRVYVDAEVDGALARGLLGRHVLRCSERESRTR